MLERPRLWLQETCPFSVVLPCPEEHAEFSQQKDLELLKSVVKFKRERAAAGSVFRGEDPPEMHVPMLSWRLRIYWFVKLHLHQREPLPTSKQPCCSSSLGPQRGPGVLSLQLPLQTHFPDGVKTFIWKKHSLETGDAEHHRCFGLHTSTSYLLC